MSAPMWLMLGMMLDDGPNGKGEWHMAHMPFSCRSAADVNCLQVLQHMADDLCLITLPEAAHTCIKVRLAYKCLDMLSRKAIISSAAAWTNFDAAMPLSMQGWV